MNTLKQLKQEIESGNKTSLELTQEALDRVSGNKNNNAFISTLSEKALKRAQKIDDARANGDILGLLAGIPIAVKDNICVKDAKVTCGSKILENFVSPYDATVVERLEDAGAVIIGKTNMDEFAMGSTSETSFYGPTLNPQDNSLIPGGSSGGSAAAVADGSVVATLGSDTGGSIRQPAACCGVVGLKPTYGRISRYGLVAYASSLDQIGPIANTVEDCAEILNVIAGADQRDQTSSRIKTDDYTALLDQDIKGKVIGIPEEYFGEGLNDDLKSQIMKVLDKLKAQGAEIKPVSLSSMQYAISSYYIIATAEASSNLSRFDGVRYTHRSQEAKSLYDMFAKSRGEGFGEEVKRRILLGTYTLSSGYYDAYYVQAQKVRRLITDDFKKAFAECDVIAAPVMPSTPLKVGEAETDPMAMYLGDIYTVSVNLAGLPGISVPCGKINNLKVGLQLIGKSFAEQELLQLASAIEKA